MDVFDLVAKINLDTSNFMNGLAQAESGAKNFGGKLRSAFGVATKAGAIMVGAVEAGAIKLGKTIVSESQNIAAYGDNIDKMSQKMGLSAEAYQEWDAVMQHSGTSIESMKSSMKILANAAQSGNEAFQAIGITQEQLATMSQQDIFEATIAGLQNVEDTTQRTYLAGKLLGRGATELGALLNTSAEETERMKQRVHELGGVMSDDAVKASAHFQDNLQDMQTAMEGVKRGIYSDFVPALSEMMDGFTHILAGEEGAEESMAKGMEFLDKAFTNMSTKINDIIEKLAPYISDFIANNLPKIFDNLINILLTIVDALIAALPGVIKTLVAQIPHIIKSILQSLTKMLPQLIKAGTELITSLAEGMSNGDSDVLDVIMDLLNALIDAIMENLPELITAGLTIVENLVLGILQKLPELITAAADIMVTLIEGIAEMLPDILQKGKDVILNIVHGITQNIPQIIQAIIQVINTLITTITENLPEILQAGIEILIELTSGLLAAIPDLVAAIPQIITALVDGLLSLDNLGKLLDAGLKLIGELVEGLMDFVLHAGGYAWDIIQALVDALGGLLWKALQIGKDIMVEVWNGLKEVFSKVLDWAKKAGKAIVDAINPFKSSGAVMDMINDVKAQASGGSSTSGMSSYVPATASDYMKKKRPYAKAMNDAYILDGATIFGMMDNSLLEGGERGQEMIVGTDYLAGMIADAITKVNTNNQPEKIIIPVYIGNERITEVVVNAQNTHNYITGGR